MESNEVYLIAVDTALSTAGVTDRGAFAIASRVFQDHPALADLGAYVENLKGQLPAHFAPPTVPPVPEVPAPREAVRQAHFLANLATIAGPETPPPSPVDATAPPTRLSRDDPQFPRLFATHAARIASGECEVV